ncbi:MAG: tetratricopeptide repeat protein [Porticoccus sp.]
MSEDEVEAIAEKGFEADRNDDLPGAMKWLKEAADLGHAKAQSMLAYKLDKADFDEWAFELYKASAEQGYAEAMYGLAGMYRMGEGTTWDEGLALQWYMKAAEANYHKAQFQIGYIYEFGNLGLDIDYEKALEWYKRPAEEGFRRAILRMILVYENGELGQAIDLVKVEYWRQKKADQESKLRQINESKKDLQ